MKSLWKLPELWTQRARPPLLEKLEQFSTSFHRHRRLRGEGDISNES